MIGRMGWGEVGGGEAVGKTLRFHRRRGERRWALLRCWRSYGGVDGGQSQKTEDR